MKIIKYMVIICISLVCMGSMSVSAQTQVDMIAKAGIVVDIETGDVLYEQDTHTKYYPASITKVMTALVVLENRKLSDVVEFSQAGLFSIEPGSSAAYIEPGEKMTVEESLYVMMLRSANDVAHGLAYEVGGDLEGFAKLMNEKAVQLGCTDTHFVNASGLHDEKHYTTASDMAKITRAAYANKTLRKIMGTVRYELPPTNKQKNVRIWINGNRMIQEGSEYYYQPCTGGKTGYTMIAGGTLVTFAKIDHRMLACVALKSQNSASAYKDSINMYEYVKQEVDFSKYNKPKIEKTGAKKIETNKQVGATWLHKVVTIMKIFGILLALLCFGVILRIIYVQIVRRRRRKTRRKNRKK